MGKGRRQLFCDEFPSYRFMVPVRRAPPYEISVYVRHGEDSTLAVELDVNDILRLRPRPHDPQVLQVLQVAAVFYFRGGRRVDAYVEPLLRW